MLSLLPGTRKSRAISNCISGHRCRMSPVVKGCRTPAGYRRVRRTRPAGVGQALTKALPFAPRFFAPRVESSTWSWAGFKHHVEWHFGDSAAPRSPARGRGLARLDRVAIVAAPEVVEIECCGCRNRVTVVANLKILGRTLCIVIAYGSLYSRDESAVGPDLD